MTAARQRAPVGVRRSSESVWMDWAMARGANAVQIRNARVNSVHLYLGSRIRTPNGKRMLSDHDLNNSLQVIIRIVFDLDSTAITTLCWLDIDLCTQRIS